MSEPKFVAPRKRTIHYMKWLGEDEIEGELDRLSQEGYEIADPELEPKDSDIPGTDRRRWVSAELEVCACDNCPKPPPKKDETRRRRKR